MKQQRTTSQSLEYIALLSGLGMAGANISDTDIQITRNVHTGNKAKKFSFASLVNVSRH